MRTCWLSEKVLRVARVSMRNSSVSWAGTESACRLAIQLSLSVACLYVSASAAVTPKRCILRASCTATCTAAQSSR